MGIFLPFLWMYASLISAEKSPDMKFGTNEAKEISSMHSSL